MANRKKIDNEYFSILKSFGSVVPRDKKTGNTLTYRVGANYQIENQQTKEILNAVCSQNMPCNLVLINQTI
jgi:hypothetical protein